MLLTTFIESQKAEANATALKHVANMLQRPDQLEKVDQHKRRVSRKKASVEAQLKTAMQSQLDGVRTGLNQLQTALSNIQVIKQNLQEIEEELLLIPKLQESLRDVRMETIKHSQYATAMENLKHIFTVPEMVEKTLTLISDGKLLTAHQCLTDLESSRDDLLFELHKLPNQSPTDRNMLRQYFIEVDKLTELLGKQLWLIFQRTLNTVRKEPVIIVTALRIIEREERIDQRHVSSGFLPPGRPKKWRNKCMEVLRRVVQERIEGNQFEERKDNKMWLVRHLEVTRLLILEDLRVVKTLCTPCFPPDYDVVNMFFSLYHECLSQHLHDVIACGLEGNEFVSLLSWLNTYTSPDLLGHPELNLDITAKGPLLDAGTVGHLKEQHLKNIERNFQDWMKNTVDSETRDWIEDKAPESDGEGFYQTTVPVIVFQMIEQNLQVAKTIDQDFSNRVLQVSMDQVIKFGKMFSDAAVMFKYRHFEDRNKIKYFTHYMIAAVNNCLHFVELCHQLTGRHGVKGLYDNNAGTLFEMTLKTYYEIRDKCTGFLLEEAFLDLESHFSDLLTRKWLTSSLSVDTICLTLEDYSSDYHHLRIKNFDLIMKEALRQVAVRYCGAMLQKRMTLKNYDERRDAAEKIVREAEQISYLFNRLAAAATKGFSPCDVLVHMAEVLKVKDTEILSLELMGMLRKYPDMNADHLTALLSLRGDIGRIEIRQMVSELLSEQPTQKGPIPKSLFSEISVVSGLFL